MWLNKIPKKQMNLYIFFSKYILKAKKLSTRQIERQTGLDIPVLFKDITEETAL